MQAFIAYDENTNQTFTATANETLVCLRVNLEKSYHPQLIPCRHDLVLFLVMFIYKKKKKVIPQASLEALPKAPKVDQK